MLTFLFMFNETKADSFGLRAGLDKNIRGLRVRLKKSVLYLMLSRKVIRGFE